MMTALSIEGVYSPTFSFTLSNADDGGTNVQVFRSLPVMRGDAIPTPDKSGAADTYVQNGQLEITVSGQIIGTSASNYWTRRMAFADAILPDQGSQTAFKHGTLKATFSGQSQVYVDFVTLEWDAPLETITPDGAAVVGEYSWKCRAPYGYWRTVSGGAVVKL